VFANLCTTDPFVSAILSGSYSGAKLPDTMSKNQAKIDSQQQAAGSEQLESRKILAQRHGELAFRFTLLFFWALFLHYTLWANKSYILFGQSRHKHCLAAQPLSVGLADVVVCLLGKFDHPRQVLLKLGQPITILGTLQFVFISPLTVEAWASYFHC
jgi:hypothetical protein